MQILKSINDVAVAATSAAARGGKRGGRGPDRGGWGGGAGAEEIHLRIESPPSRWTRSPAGRKGEKKKKNSAAHSVIAAVEEEDGGDVDVDDEVHAQKA